MSRLDEVGALQGLDRMLVEVLAVADEPLRMGVLADIASSARSSWGHKKLDAKAIGKAARALVERGLLVEEQGLAIQPSLREPVTRRVIRDGHYRLLVTEIDEAQKRVPRQTWMYGPSAAARRRAGRAAFVDGDVQDFWSYLRVERDPSFLGWVTGPLEFDFIRDDLDPSLAALVVDRLTRHDFAGTKAMARLGELVAALVDAHDLPELKGVAAWHALQGGDLAGAQARLEGLGDDQEPGWQAVVALAAGDVKRAATLYAKALASVRRQFGSNQALPAEPEGAFIVLAYVLAGGLQRPKQAFKLAQLALEMFRGIDDRCYGGWLHLARLVDPAWALGGHTTHPAGVLMEALVGAWTDKPIDEARLANARATCDKLGWAWLSSELAAVSGGAPIDGAVALVSHRQAEPEWRTRLDALERLVGPGASKPEAGKRLVWVLERAEPFDMTALEQSRAGKGWSSGRKVALSRLARLEKKLPLTDADRRLAACLREHSQRSWRGYRDTWHEWDAAAAWQALAGHPNVIDEDGRPVTVVALKPRLVVQPSGDRIELVIEPDPVDGAQFVERVGDSGFQVTSFSRKALQVAELLADGLRVPASQRADLERLLDGLGEHFQRAEEGAGHALAGAEGDPTPVVVLVPLGAGVAARVVALPVGKDGPQIEPGEGAAVLLAHKDGHPLRVQRDLQAEQAKLRELEAACPALGAAEWDGERRVLPTPHEALALLEELQAAGARTWWPEGETLRLRATRSSSDLRVSVHSIGEWFQAGGKLLVDEELTLELAELLALVVKSPSRFVELDDGSFLALTEQLRRQLDVLARVGRSKRGKVDVHPLAAEALSPLVEAAQATVDPAWTARLERLRAPPPDADVPEELQAELRPYQADGFRWLARMAALGAGVCLADDMGLGKTIEALALLLHRAADGPALVVAPTSVCGNWRRETWRFAPSLRVVDLAVQGDRALALSQLGAGNLVVCSYGVCVTESEALAQVPWSTLVLDESQAIKNPETQRHKAACGLPARFRLVLTGTPVENHLLELWAQFSFLNPGMLGSQRGFRDRFVRPIETGDARVQAQLKRLVAPYVLRRLKSRVLDDLPPRSEISLPIELSPPEAAFYEALRLKALQALEEDEEVSQLQVLAHLTTLRLAACSPALAGGTAPERGSAKLRAFAHLVEGLEANHHRALVFSQFVRHLATLREWLDQAGIEYQYLDGSTPPKERERAVADFQAGKGRVFLISLRAGGFGLNLTAADFVIHMDPWWNPAVEDQASDRAHRIGQTRPVTVYRLVAQGTIEEKILDLHHSKRDLADRLLAGADAAARLSGEEMLALLRGG